MGKVKYTLAILALTTSSLTQADIITVDYSGEVTRIGISLENEFFDSGSVMSGSFTYDSDLGSADTLSAFTISIGDFFTAGMDDVSSYFSVQNDQQNGLATLPADGLVVGSSFTSTSLNGNTSGNMQFGLLRDNIDGQLWDDTFLPDLSDWTSITLADIQNPDWHWMDFGLITDNFWEDQIRWEVLEFGVSGTTTTPDPDPGTSVPEPSTVVLFGSGLFALGLARRRRHIKK